jgi:hypothetical protein
MEKLTWLTAITLPYDFVRFLTSMTLLIAL